MDVDADQRCEVFCIEGIPAASMLYNTTNAAGGRGRVLPQQSGPIATIFF